jgi:O-antigen ligase
MNILPEKTGLGSTPVLILTSLLLVTMGWMLFISNLSVNISLISSVSEGVGSFRDKPIVLVSIGILTSYALVVISAVLLSVAPHVFVGVLVFLMAVSEAHIPVVQQISLSARYILMVILIVNGTLVLMRKGYSSLRFVQKLGILILIIVLMHFAFDEGKLESALMLPVQFAMFLGVLIGLGDCLDENENLRKLSVSLAVVGLLMTAVNVLGFHYANMPYEGGRYKSWYPLATGFANNYVLLLVPVAWLLIDSKSMIKKVFLFTFFLCGSYMVAISGTRNAIFALMVALSIFIIFWRPVYLLLLFIVAAPIVGYFGVSNHSIGDFGDAGIRVLSGVSADETRFGVWRLAFEFIGHKPIWGYGLSTSLRTLTEYLPDWERFDSHNAMLGVWIKLGIIGVVSYLMLFGASIVRGLKILKESRASSNGSCFVLFLSIVFIILISGLFEENLSSRGSIQQVLLVLGVLVLNVNARVDARGVGVNKIDGSSSLWRDSGVHLQKNGD